jgi:methyl-accepting chemotaxis protein
VQEFKRRRNFLSKKGLQLRLVGKILMIVIAATVLSITTTTLLYYELSNVPFKGDIPFYYITDDMPEGDNVPTALDVLLPGLIVSGVVMISFAFILGVFMTHRIAGAIYRIQKDSMAVGDGDLSLHIRLREKDELHDVADDINNMIVKIRKRICLIRDQLNAVYLLLTEKENLKKEKKIINLVQEAQEAVKDFKLEES